MTSALKAITSEMFALIVKLLISDAGYKSVDVHTVSHVLTFNELVNENVNSGSGSDIDNNNTDSIDNCTLLHLNCN